MRKNNFNLIRLILAIIVILCHNTELLSGNRKSEIFTVLFNTQMSSGLFSVTLFFVISGYLIVQSWDKNHNASKFLLNRIFRIYPAFIVASIISCFLFGAFAGNKHYFQEFKFKYFIFNSLVLKIPITPKIFANSFYPYINGSMWTINNEFVCYLFILLLGVLNFVKNRFKWLIFFSIFFSTTLIANYFDFKIIVSFLRNYIIADFINIKLIFAFFIGGTYYLFGKAYLNRKPIYIIAAVLMFICFFSTDLVEYLFPILGGYIVLSFAETSTTFLSGFNKLPDISYGIYLYGWPISKLIIFYQPKIDYWLLSEESLFVAVLFGLLSWYLIEKPFIMFNKRGFAEKQSNQTAIVTS
jgi:peptidoglycan/LPS O-acetylase OafA/YrhL